MSRILPAALNSTEDDKNKIRRHPLMPVLQALLQRCEQICLLQKQESTAVPDPLKLLKYMDSIGISPETADNTLDALMWNTALMLQIFIAELDKVGTLTDSFAENYKNGLKNRLTHTSMCGSPTDFEDDLITVLEESNSLATIMTSEGAISITVPQSSLENSSIINTICDKDYR